MDRHACLADRKTRHAVLFTLLLIGEAAARLLAKRPDFTGRFDDIPWRAMKGMRNRIVHAYQDLDHDTVWTTVDQDLRRLIDALSAASRVASMEDQSDSAGG